MKSIYKAILVLIVFLSCTNKDTITEEKKISVNDLTIKIDENPTENLELGNIKASTSNNDEKLNFTILEQSPNNAVKVDSTTGRITVFNKKLFDFETNPIIKVIVKVSSGEVSKTTTVTILLNDIEEITIETKNLTISINENPESELLLAKIEGKTNIGKVTFSIIGQSPKGAIFINSKSGEVKVNDRNVFDFEKNPVIVAEIKVANKGKFKVSNLTINLKDINELSLQERLNNGEFPISLYRENSNNLNKIYGLSFKGGLIFHLDTKTGNTFIAAPSDQSDYAVWGCEGTNISGAEFSELGTGKSNTQAIVSVCKTNEIAARICDNYYLDGSDEWHLPSKNELNLMYLNLKMKGIGNFNDGWYWSSTEFEDQSYYDKNGYDAVWVQSFKDGTQATYDIGIKRFKNRVRAVRLIIF